MSDLVSKWQKANSTWITEGSTGVKNLSKLCEDLGYQQDNFLHGSSIERLLEDNQGAIEALLEWIEENHSDALKELVACDDDEEQDDE
jgi:hypothetical protein